MPAVAAHVALAVALLLILNWISNHSGWWGYRHLTMVDEDSGAPTHNVTYRVLSPVVFLTVTAGLWYAIGLDWVVRDYYLVTVYYFVLRVGLALALGRGLLVRWGRQFALAGTSIVISFALYEKVLRFRRSLLPDPTNLANELWIIIILFLYRTFNNVQWPTETPDVELRRRYISDRFRRYQQRYGAVVGREVDDPAVRALIYAVMIYESFNRPSLYQFLERHVLARVRARTSLGPLQVQSTTRLTPEASVREGARLLRGFYEDAVRSVVAEQRASTAGEHEIAASMDEAADAPVDAPAAPLPSYLRTLARTRALAQYNVRSDYPRAVADVYATLVEEHFPELGEAESDEGGLG